jgi:hypothetical protein
MTSAFLNPTGESSTLGVGGQRGRVAADQPHQLDAELGQGAEWLNVAARALDEVLKQLLERRYRAVTDEDRDRARLWAGEPIVVPDPPPARPCSCERSSTRPPPTGLLRAVVRRIDLLDPPNWLKENRDLHQLVLETLRAMGERTPPATWSLPPPDGGGARRLTDVPNRRHPSWGASRTAVLPVLHGSAVQRLLTVLNGPAECGWLGWV